jgi:tetratricopeptide (TPR) repeat protein
MIVTDTAPNKVSSWNRQTYQRLKLALSLNLRRQLFVAVCDDLSLRNRLAGTLHAELGTASAKASDTQGYPKLVSLNLSLSDPNPLGQIAQWSAQNRQPRSAIPTPAFQILGVERLTRRSPSVQRLFLRRLQAIERHLPRLESTLLLWLPRPWFYTIQQSVPEFWQWHTGIFEFEGQPTPLPPVGASKPEASHTSTASEEKAGSFPAASHPSPKSEEKAGSFPVASHPSPKSEEKAGSFPAASHPSSASEEGKGSFKEDLQRLLAHDLVEDVDLASLSEISQENQHASDDSRNHQTNSGTATDKTNNQPAPAPNQGTAISSDQEVPIPNPQSVEPLQEEQQNAQNLQSASPPSPTSQQQSTPSTSPADTYLQLGNYYHQAIEQGDVSEENLAIAIQAYEQALQFLEDGSPQASGILNNIGNLYWMLSRNQTSAEHRLSYMEQSIQSYELALTKLTTEPNQETAISSGNQEVPIPNPQAGEPPQEEQQNEQDLQSASPPSAADAYLQLGNYYRQAIEQGEASEENLAIAIQAYEQALQFLDDGSPEASDILNDIGNLYWMLSRNQTNAEHTLSYLEQSIQSYQRALTNLTAEDAPHTYGMIQNNLGAAYGDLARYQDSTENLEQSIRAYEEALRYRRADSEPMKYASTQNNLGTAYWHLAQQQSSVPNLRAAIAAYSEALSYYNPQSDSMSWAMIQNNLGTAFWNLAQYEQPETWLQRATVAYQEALKYRTPEVAPSACAASQNNLGTAYWHLADQHQDDPEQKAEYLHKCIAAYESAIALVQELSRNTPPIPISFDVFATHNNLGLAYYQLATELQFSLPQDSKFAHLEAALQQHVQACTGVPAQSDAYQTALSYIVGTIRVFYNEGGINGQNRALSKVPGHLLPEILPRL